MKNNVYYSYDVSFHPLPDDRLQRKNVFFNGYTYNQSVAGFEIRLARKVRVKKY